MACYHEISRISGPSQQAETAWTSPSLDHKSIQDDGTEIFQSHYWRRVFATDIRCGDSTDVKISTKAGVSETLLAEAAGALEIAVPVLKSTLSPKVSQSNTISQERVIEFTRKLSASKCRGLTFAEWQKTERITIRRPRRLSHLRFHEQTRHIDNRTEEFCPDYYDYPAAECCEDQYKKQIVEGFATLHPVVFGSMTRLFQGRQLSGDRFELLGIEGSFTLGQEVPFSAFAKYFDHMQSASKPTVGYLDIFFWPTTSLLPEDRMPSKFNPLGSFLLGLAGGVAAVVVIDYLSNRGTKLELPESFERAKQRFSDVRSDIEAAVEAGREAMRKSETSADR